MGWERTGRMMMTDDAIRQLQAILQQGLDDHDPSDQCCEVLKQSVWSAQSVLGDTVWHGWRYDFDVYYINMMVRGIMENLLMALRSQEANERLVDWLLSMAEEMCIFSSTLYSLADSPE